MWALPHDRAWNLQTSLEGLFHTEDWFPEFEAEPITAEEILGAILEPDAKLGEHWWPARLRSYVDRYLDAHPEIPSLEEEIEEAFVRSERASNVLRELRAYVTDASRRRDETVSPRFSYLPSGIRK